MNLTMIVLILWLGGGHGGPAVIQGFDSLRSCEMAAAQIKARSSVLNPVIGYNPPTECMILER